mmetsp:Transcript_2694/g.4283  ORF Transcript_2694/g.4283 Transcript_2694/m.4283 type:complete len:211 (-) Transcript_2694:389-1021(-)
MSDDSGGSPLAVINMAAGASFYWTSFQCFTHMTPHFFGHNCPSCHKAGIIKCIRCDGWGTTIRAKTDDRQGGKIVASQGIIDDGPQYVGCYHCKGRGTEKCMTCDGQGWRKQSNINERQFLPTPMFETYHQSRNVALAEQRLKVKKAGKQAFEFAAQAGEAGQKEQEEVDRALRKERKAAKEEGKGKDKGKDKGKKGKDTADKDKADNKA